MLDLPIEEPRTRGDDASSVGTRDSSSAQATDGDELAVPSGEVEAGSEETTRWGRLLRAAFPSIIVAGGLGALNLWRRRFQHSQLFMPEKFPNGLWNPQSFGVMAEDVWFESQDGTPLHGWWIPFRRARGTVLYCHGNAGNITNRLGVYQFLKRVRLNVLTFDYRGYGRSEGRPSEGGVFADARAAYDYLLGELQETPERILIFGHSLGGAIAIDCASHRSAAGLVVQSSFTNLKEMARARFPGWPLHLIANNQFDSLGKVPELNLPKLFLHGASDETIPISLGERLFEHAAEPKEWYAVPHAGHNDVYRHGGLRYLWKLAGFCRRSLRAAKKRS